MCIAFGFDLPFNRLVIQESNLRRYGSERRLFENVLKLIFSFRWSYDKHLGSEILKFHEFGKPVFHIRTVFNFKNARRHSALVEPRNVNVSSSVQHTLISELRELRKGRKFAKLLIYVLLLPVWRKQSDLYAVT